MRRGWSQRRADPPGGRPRPRLGELCTIHHKFLDEVFLYKLYPDPVGQMIPDPIVSRQAVRELVDDALARLGSGRGLTVTETERIDFKEEAGRRDRGGGLLPGSPQNPAASAKLADEVRCFSNTPEGGAIIVGVDDKTHALLGTALDPEWLRQRINDLTGVAPAVEVRTTAGARLLVIFVAESAEPVEDPDQRLRWRVGDQCRTVDRAEWWNHRAERIGVDPMAVATPRRLANISPEAVAVARSYLVQGGEADAAESDARQLFTRLGVLRPDGALSQAGVLVFCASPRPLLELSRLDVAGGEVTLRYTHPTGLSLLEALQQVEQRLDTINAIRPASRGFVESGQRLLPVRAVREAVLNHLTHRDWHQPEATSVRWIDADDTLEVTSPGGFTGGVTPTNALTTRYARYPALADLFRALRLVDRQGVGVPRMYQTMLAGGHLSPVLEEIAGPRVRTTLPGRPLAPVLAGLMGSIEPEPRRRDVRVAVVVNALLRRPYLSESQASEVLQLSRQAAVLALSSIEECRIGTTPVFRRFPEGWRLNGTIAAQAARGAYGVVPASRDLLWYRVGGSATVRRVAQLWLAEHTQVTSGDIALLTGMAQPNVSTTLSSLAESADTVMRGPGRGRAAHFVRASESS